MGLGGCGNLGKGGGGGVAKSSKRESVMERLITYIYRHEHKSFRFHRGLVGLEPGKMDARLGSNLIELTWWKWD